MIKTRNTFCGTWCLPHSRVHNYWTAIFLHPVWNLTSPSTWSTSLARFPIKRVNYGVRPYSVNKGYNAYFSLCMQKRPYFCFRSEIWRHHGVYRLRFRIWSKNFGDLQTFEGDIEVARWFSGWNVGLMTRGRRFDFQPWHCLVISELDDRISRVTIMGYNHHPSQLSLAFLLGR